MNGVVIGTLMVLGMVQQTDTVFPVDGATRLEVDSPGGSITIGVWDRSEVRIQAEHSARTFVDIDRRGTSIDVEAEARRGPANIVDFVITVPRSMDIEADGMYTDILVEGADGQVEAESVHGDVTIRGGRGVVKATSVQGRVLVEGSRGRVEVETAASEVRIRNASGEILVESAGGDIIMENLQATSVDAGTVGGRVFYEGTFSPTGTYFFGSHGGSVTLSVPDGAAASMTLSTIYGSITSNLPGAPARFERGQRNAFELNGGGAVVEVETFGGRIRVVRAGTESAPAARPREPGAGPAGWSAGAAEAWGEAFGATLGESLGDAVAVDVAASMTGLGHALSWRISEAVERAYGGSFDPDVRVHVNPRVDGSRRK